MRFSARLYDGCSLSPKLWAGLLQQSAVNCSQKLSMVKGLSCLLQSFYYTGQVIYDLVLTHWSRISLECPEAMAILGLLA